MRAAPCILLTSVLACSVNPAGLEPASDTSTSTSTSTSEPDSTTRSTTTAAGSTTASLDDTASVTTTTAATTIATGSSGSSGPGDPLDLCDGLDNDSDGAIDEPSEDNLVCDDCTSIILGNVAFTTCTAEASWTDARARCMTLGGDLAAFTNVGEQQLVVARGSGDRWIGLTDAAREGAWTWADGAALGFDDWRATEPDDWPPGEDCGQIRGGDEGWGDAGCESLRDYICAVPL